MILAAKSANWQIHPFLPVHELSPTRIFGPMRLLFRSDALGWVSWLRTLPSLFAPAPLGTSSKQLATDKSATNIGTIIIAFIRV